MHKPLLSDIPNLKGAVVQKETENFLMIYSDELVSLETLESLRGIGLRVVSVEFNWRAHLSTIICEKVATCN